MDEYEHIDEEEKEDNRIMYLQSPHMPNTNDALVDTLSEDSTI